MQFFFISAVSLNRLLLVNLSLSGETDLNLLAESLINITTGSTNLDKARGLPLNKINVHFGSITLSLL